ncbi:hypothetical protein J4440_05375 [Candidatus Woesearchaeota archaeon]|nr:hypothetical protein [Candidatus Woesearchaeota archaeon]
MIVRKCRTKGAYEAIPKKIMNLDFNKLRNKSEVIADLPILIIIKYENIKVTCYKNGKLLIKTDSQETAEKIAKEIYEL